MTSCSICLILHVVVICLSFGDTVAVTENEISGEVSCQKRLDKLEREMQRVAEAFQSRSEMTHRPYDIKSDGPVSPDVKFSAKRSDDFGPLGPVVETLSSKVTELETQLTALQHALLSQGSVYVRWGRNACPDQSDTVYAGYAGGSWYGDHGSGSNLLCLPPDPIYDNLTHTTCGPSTIYGAEYDVCPAAHHDMDIVCALCRSPSTTVMIPATTVCPYGWSPEYSGHLMSSYGGNEASTDYVCVDGDPEDRPGGEDNRDGVLLFYTWSKCGSLPCPPYQNNKILTCVVCSR